MNILIVDDDNDKISKIVSVIKDTSESFIIDTVIDSYSAQIKLQQNKYDLLLLDLLLPTRLGLEPLPNGGQLLLKEIARNKSLIPPTIIVGVTQYEECKDNFSTIWKVLLFNNAGWVEDLKQILNHLERAIKVHSNSNLIIKPALFVEGETDAKIIEEAIRLFTPELESKIDIKFQKSGGANWVANQIVAWAFSLHKNKDRSLIKSVGLLDGDQAGLAANEEINRVVKPDSSGANTFKVIKLKPDYAKNTIPLYQKGLEIPITLEELYPPSFWRDADGKGWLEERQKLDMFLRDPKSWDKRNQSLNDFISKLNLCPDESIYLKSYKLSSKEDAVKFIIRMGESSKRKVLKNFEKLLVEISGYLKA